MRRVPAILLLAVFSLSLIGPALFADTDTNLPACCRRDGQHHCDMMSTRTDSASDLSMHTSARRCPFFPKTGALLPHAGPALPTASQSLSAVLLVDRHISAHKEPGHPVALALSHHKRGPPVLSY